MVLIFLGKSDKEHYIFSNIGQSCHQNIHEQKESMTNQTIPDTQGIRTYHLSLYLLTITLHEVPVIVLGNSNSLALQAFDKVDCVFFPCACYMYHSSNTHTHIHNTCTIPLQIFLFLLSPSYFFDIIRFISNRSVCVCWSYCQHFICVALHIHIMVLWQIYSIFCTKK